MKVDLVCLQGNTVIFNNEAQINILKRVNSLETPTKMQSTDTVKYKFAHDVESRMEVVWLKPWYCLSG